VIEVVVIPALAAQLGIAQDAYPHHLAEQYPRILEQIIANWGSSQLERYISDLTLDERGDRQGFPPEVASELFLLYRLHCAQREAQAPANEQAWDHIKESGHGFSHDDVTVSKADFFCAAERGNTLRVLMYLKSGIPIETRDEFGKTPLIWAATFSHLALVGLLLSRRADTETRDLGGFTALHWAAANGNDVALSLLLEHGAQIDAQNHVGVTPLMQAASRGQRNTLRLLLEAGAAMQQTDQNGQTALFYALKNNHFRVTETLLQQQSKIDAAGAAQQSAFNAGLNHSDTNIRQLFVKYRYNTELSASDL
jgi:ankyrin repeat protein